MMISGMHRRLFEGRHLAFQLFFFQNLVTVDSFRKVSPTSVFACSTRTIALSLATLRLQGIDAISKEIPSQRPFALIVRTLSGLARPHEVPPAPSQSNKSVDQDCIAASPKFSQFFHSYFLWDETRLLLLALCSDCARCY